MNVVLFIIMNKVNYIRVILVRIHLRFVFEIGDELNLS